MPRHAWVEVNVVRDYTDYDPHEVFHPDVAAHYSVIVPSNVERQWRLINNEWVEPPAPLEGPPPSPPPPPPPPTLGRIISPAQFLMLFTPLERVAIRNSTDAVVVDFIRLVELPSLTQVELDNPQTQLGVQYLVSEGLITSERATAILAAQPLG